MHSNNHVCACSAGSLRFVRTKGNRRAVKTLYRELRRFRLNSAGYKADSRLFGHEDTAVPDVYHRQTGFNHVKHVEVVNVFPKLVCAGPDYRRAACCSNPQCLAIHAIDVLVVEAQGAENVRSLSRPPRSSVREPGHRPQSILLMESAGVVQHSTVRTVSHVRLTHPWQEMQAEGRAFTFSSSEEPKGSSFRAACAEVRQIQPDVKCGLFCSTGTGARACLFLGCLYLTKKAHLALHTLHFILCLHSFYCMASCPKAFRHPIRVVGHTTCKT